MPWNSTSLPWKVTAAAMTWNAKPTAGNSYADGLKWNDPRLPWKA